MEAIILAIISGSFSLAGIWYQNYLSRKSITADIKVVPEFQEVTKPGENELLAPQQNKRSQLRTLFTILIAILPWLIWKFLVFMFNKIVYGYMNTYAKVMVIYFLLWLIITITAILSGWALKTVFEKLILTISSVFLLFWGIWMIVVHHLY